MAVFGLARARALRQKETELARIRASVLEHAVAAQRLPPASASTVSPSSPPPLPPPPLSPRSVPVAGSFARFRGSRLSIRVESCPTGQCPIKGLRRAARRSSPVSLAAEIRSRAAPIGSDSQNFFQECRGRGQASAGSENRTRDRATRR